METKKKKKNYSLIIIILFFIFFLALYSSQVSGYYEYGQYKKTALTNEAIKKYEEDIKKGKEIESENYINSTYKDYSNGLSKIGFKTSSFIEKIFTKGIKSTFRYLSKLVLE